MAKGKGKNGFRKRNFRKGRKTSAGLVATIKRVMKKQAEVKSASYTNSSWAINTYAQYGTMSCTTLSPQDYVITQGTGQGNRIGNRISTKKCMLRMVAWPLPYSATTNPAPVPVNVVIWIGKLKNNVNLPVGADFAKFFNNGNGYVAPTSNIQDLNRPVNKEIFTIVKKFTFKLGSGSVSGTGADATRQFYDNNDYKFNMIKSLDITKLMAKTYIYNDSANPPTNSGLYMWGEALLANGTTSSIYQYIDCSYTIDYSYTDL